MGFRLLRLIIAVGLLMLAIGLGMLVDGDLGGGLPLFAAGLVLVGVPAGLLVRHVREIWTTGYSRSPAMADPRLRRTFRNAGASVLVSAALSFVAVFVVLFAFYRIGSDDGATAGDIASTMVLGCFFAGLPGLLGIQFLRCGQLLLHGDTSGIGGAMRLGWIVVVVGGLVTASSLSDGRVAVGLLTGALVAVALVNNLWLGGLHASVLEYGRQERAARQTGSEPL